MKRISMVSRRTLYRLSTFAKASSSYLFNRLQAMYLERLRKWLGDAAVVDYHTSKSCQFPLVRAANGVLLGYNLYVYAVFIPRSIWRKVDSASKSCMRKLRTRMFYAFVEWRPGQGEVLLVGGVDLVEKLLAIGVLAPESRAHDTRHT
jgi:hypothetical protein